MEVVREKPLNYVHQVHVTLFSVVLLALVDYAEEIPYQIEHRLMDWKELRDASLRIEQHLYTLKESQHRILVGKKGSKIGTIGVEANEELRNIYRRDVHLVLQVRVTVRGSDPASVHRFVFAPASILLPIYHDVMA